MSKSIAKSVKSRLEKVQNTKESAVISGIVFMRAHNTKKRIRNNKSKTKKRKPAK
jgi:hypothetical protein